MTVQCCGSCGRLFARGTHPWIVVDPGRPAPVDWLCGRCERFYEAANQVLVFTDHQYHVATLLSDRGMRAARHDFRNGSVA